MKRLTAVTRSGHVVLLKGCDARPEGRLKGLCVIDCTAQDACADLTGANAIFCFAGFACRVECGGQDSCRNSEIECPDLYACEIVCSAQSSFRDGTIRCGSGTCTTDCQADNDECRGATILCGPEACSVTCAGTSHLPTLTCGASCDCNSC